MPPLSNGVLVFCHPRGSVYFSCYCIIVVAKEKSPEIMNELNLGLCGTPERSIFSCTHIIHLIVATRSIE